MRRSLYLLAISLLLIAAPVLAPGVARAGGPTSAIIVSPATGATGAIYYSDAEYQELMSLLSLDSAGATAATGTSETARVDEFHASGEYVTITWLIHDVMVWRVDHVYLDGGEPSLVRTQESAHLGTVNADPFDPDAGDLHRPGDPQQLGALLDRLLTGPAAAETTSGDTTSAETTSAETTSAETTSVDRSADETSEAAVAAGQGPTRPAAGSLAWAGAGLLVGVIGCLLALLVVQWWRRRASADDADSRPLPVIMLPE